MSKCVRRQRRRALRSLGEHQRAIQERRSRPHFLQSDQSLNVGDRKTRALEQSSSSRPTWRSLREAGAHSIEDCWTHATVRHLSIGLKQAHELVFSEEGC